MKTIDSILEDMQQRVQENQPVSPAMWIDAGIKLNALKGDLDNSIADFEANLALVEADLIEQGETSSKAKTLSKAKVDYAGYLKAKAKSLRIIEFIRLAKQRAKIEEFNL